MNFKEFYDFQMKNLEKGVTQEDLDKLTEKKFSSGREIKIGDKIITGILNIPDEKTKLPITIISLHPEELGTVYVQDEQMTKSGIGLDLPMLKKIK